MRDYMSKNLQTIVAGVVAFGFGMMAGHAIRDDTIDLGAAAVLAGTIAVYVAAPLAAIGFAAWMLGFALEAVVDVFGWRKILLAAVVWNHDRMKARKK